MSDADCTPGREPRSVTASLYYFYVSVNWCMFAFVVLGLVSSLASRNTGWQECVWNHLVHSLYNVTFSSCWVCWYRIESNTVRSWLAQHWSLGTTKKRRLVTSSDDNAIASRESRRRYPASSERGAACQKRCKTGDTQLHPWNWDWRTWMPGRECQLYPDFVIFQPVVQSCGVTVVVVSFNFLRNLETVASFRLRGFLNHFHRDSLHMRHFMP